MNWKLAMSIGLLSAVALTGCSDDNSLEDAGEKIEDAADDAGDAVEDAVDDAIDDVEDAVDDK